ncbi:MAG: hypothetical protein ABIG39_04485 [Candidatus Micrarchaeota archaeon]
MRRERIKVPKGKTIPFVRDGEKTLWRLEQVQGVPAEKLPGIIKRVTQTGDILLFRRRDATAVQPEEDYDDGNLSDPFKVMKRRILAREG